jgi:hypothetical protein
MKSLLKLQSAKQAWSPECSIPSTTTKKKKTLEKSYFSDKHGNLNNHLIKQLPSPNSLFSKLSLPQKTALPPPQKAKTKESSLKSSFLLIPHNSYYLLALPIRYLPYSNHFSKSWPLPITSLNPDHFYSSRPPPLTILITYNGLFTDLASCFYA